MDFIGNLVFLWAVWMGEPLLSSLTKIVLSPSEGKEGYCIISGTFVERYSHCAVLLSGPNRMCRGVVNISLIEV